MKKLDIRISPLVNKRVGLLCIFIGLFSTVGLQGNSQTKIKSAKNAPVFSNVVYEGKDHVYKDNPLGGDEFYMPVLLYATSANDDLLK